MERNLGLAALALLCLGSSPGAAAPRPIDLAQYARITATGVKHRQVAGWIYDEADGPAAVRDQDLQTGWRPLPEGEQRLVLDFAHINPAPFRLAEVRVTWAPPPQGEVLLLFGNSPTQLEEVGRGAGEQDAFVFESPAPRGRYLALVVRDAGSEARLAELVVHGQGLKTVPKLEISAQESEKGLRLSWPARDPSRTHHVEVHRALDAGFLPSPASRLAVLGREGVVVVPPPLCSRPAGYQLAVVAVGHDGTRQEASLRPTQACVVRHEPAFRLRGVVEGFYGRPWPHDQRLRMIQLLGDQGLNFYAYAPKDDPKHREAWRQAYSLAELEGFAQLLAAGVRHGVRVAYTVSPGLSIDPWSEADVDALLAKFDPLIDIGFTDFGLLLDDIPVRPGRVAGDAHVRLVVRVRQHLATRLRGKEFLFFVPTVYSGQAGTLDSDQIAYLSALGALPDDVPIAWTGPGVFSRNLSVEHVVGIRRLMEDQPLLLWDNYPVNDVCVRRDLFLGAVLGRDPELGEHVEGLLANPMVQGAASRVPVRAYADLLVAPVDYDAARSFRAALEAEARGGDLECLAALAGYFTGSPRVATHAPDAEPVKAAVEAFLDSLGKDDAQTRGARAQELVLLLAQAWRSETCLQAGVPDLDLVDDLAPAARAVADLGREGMEAVRFALARGHKADTAGEKRRVRKALYSLKRDLWEVGGRVGPRLLSGVLDAALEAPLAAEDPLPRVAGDPPASARVGEPYGFTVTVTPRESQATLRLVGPETMAVDAAGRVTWTPQVAGARRFVVVASTTTGLDVLPVEVRVEPAAVAALDRDGRCGCGCAAVAEGRPPLPLALVALMLLVRRRREPTS